MWQPESSVPKPDRHVKEKNRRQKMKGLYQQLAAVVSPENSLEKSSNLDVLDHATNGIKQLQKNVNELKAKKDSLQLPLVEIAVKESATGESLEINIVCGSEKKKLLKMHKIFQILEEGGAEVVSATNSTVGLKVQVCNGIYSRSFFFATFTCNARGGVVIGLAEFLEKLLLRNSSGVATSTCNTRGGVVIGDVGENGRHSKNRDDREESASPVADA
nr:transcription factor bHLH168-like [Ipomoea batatas]